MQADLNKIDNVLLKTGIAAAAILVFAAVTWRPWESRLPVPRVQGEYLVTQVNGRGRIIDERVHVHPSIVTEKERMANLEGRYPNALLIRRSPPPKFSLNVSREEWYFIAAALAPFSLIVIGLLVRRREKRMVSIWKHLRHNVETHVPTLLGNTDFTRRELETTVRLLNNRGLAYYAWDRRADTIEDGRLASGYVHINKCDSCGASVSLKVRANLREAPVCPYCQGGVTAGGLNALKLKALAQLRNDGEVSPQPVSARPMSVGLFVVLVVFCWPAAIAYAVYKSQSARRLV